LTAADDDDDEEYYLCGDAVAETKTDLY